MTSCRQLGSMTSCDVTCRADTVSVFGSNSVTTQCGVTTGYSWSHNVNNQSLPTCSGEHKTHTDGTTVFNGLNYLLFDNFQHRLSRSVSSVSFLSCSSPLSATQTRNSLPSSSTTSSQQSQVQSTHKNNESKHKTVSIFCYLLFLV